jgi:hypothetical protein
VEVGNTASYYQAPDISLLPVVVVPDTAPNMEKDSPPAHHFRPVGHVPALALPTELGQRVADLTHQTADLAQAEDTAPDSAVAHIQAAAVPNIPDLQAADIDQAEDKAADSHIRVEDIHIRAVVHNPVVDNRGLVVDWGRRYIGEEEGLVEMHRLQRMGLERDCSNSLGRVERKEGVVLGLLEEGGRVSRGERFRDT